MAELHEPQAENFTELQKSERMIEIYEKIKADFLDKNINPDSQLIQTYLENLLIDTSDIFDKDIISKIIEDAKLVDLYSEIFSRLIDIRIEKQVKSFEQLISRNSPKFICDNKDAIRDVEQLDLLQDPSVLDLGNPDGRDVRLARLANAYAILFLKQNLEAANKQKTPAYINLITALNAPAEIERQGISEKTAAELIVEEGELSLIPSKIPRNGGIITLPVIVDAEGVLHARNYVVEKQGKDRKEKLVIDFGSMRAPKGLIGDVQLSFRLIEKEGEVLKLADPGAIFESADSGMDYRERYMVRPVAYIQENGCYVLPDGRYFVIASDDVSKIDVQTGFSKTEIGLSMNKFPVVDIVGTKRFSPNESVEYFGNILSPKEFEYREKLEALFEHYFQRSKQGVFDKYALAVPKKEWLRVSGEMRETSQRYPIDVVVSASAVSVRSGFNVFDAKLAGIEKTSENRDLIERLRGLYTDARKTHDIFVTQAQPENQVHAKEFFKNSNAWNSYVEFFRLLESGEVKKLFGHSDIRQALFASDLDGETAIEFFRMAGIRTTVIPFVPDQKRRDPYVSSAIHLDISHGTGSNVLFNASGPWNGVSVFLDEDDQHVFSAAHATYNHLQNIGLLESNKIAPYLINFIDDHDGYRGIYASKEGATAILENEFKNIYGIGSICIASGRYTAVLDFFKKYVPEMEAHIIKKNPDSAKNSDVLRQLVLKELVKFDVRPFFKNLFGDDVELMSKDLAEKNTTSSTSLEALEREGFVSDSIFGKTLWDPFGAVEHQGLAAFVAGFDCYIQYNRKNKTCVVNLSPIPSQTAKRKDIPPDLFVLRGGETVGAVIKGGRYLVMNSSSRRVKSFGFIVDSIIGYKQAPQAIREYCDREADEDRNIKINLGLRKGQRPFDSRLVSQMYHKVVPVSVRERHQRRRDELMNRSLEDAPSITDIKLLPADTEPTSQRENIPPVSAEFSDSQTKFSSHIASLEMRRSEAFSEEARELRCLVAHEFEAMASAAAEHPTPESEELLRVAREAMFEDIRETEDQMMELLETIETPDFEDPEDSIQFYRHLQDVASEDSGLMYYEAVIGLSLNNDLGAHKTK